MTADFSPDSHKRLQATIDQHSLEIAELRQLVGALTLVVSDGTDTEFVESYELIVGWALEEFDPEILRELLAQYDLPQAGMVPQKVLETTSVKLRPAESQKQLFSDEEPYDERDD